MPMGAEVHRKSMNKRCSPQEEANIVVEFFTTNISAAVLCCKHNVSPATFQVWKGVDHSIIFSSPSPAVSHGHILPQNRKA